MKNFEQRVFIRALVGSSLWLWEVEFGVLERQEAGGPQQTH